MAVIMTKWGTLLDIYEPEPINWELLNRMHAEALAVLADPKLEAERRKRLGLEDDNGIERGI